VGKLRSRFDSGRGVGEPVVEKAFGESGFVTISLYPAATPLSQTLMNLLMIPRFVGDLLNVPSAGSKNALH